MFTQTAVVQVLCLASVASARLFDREPGEGFFGAGGGALLEKYFPLFPTPPTSPTLPIPMSFNRISHFAVCSQLDPTCNVDNETSSEIIVASKDGNTLYYSDSPLGVLGIVDISDPLSPLPGGILDMGGEPTSTGVVNDWILVAVNTSPNFTDPSGNLQVVDPETLEVVRTFDLGGQVSCAYYDSCYCVVTRPKDTLQRFRCRSCRLFWPSICLFGI